MVNDKIMRELQEILGELYIKNGISEEVVRLSQLVDKIIVSKQGIIRKTEELNNKNNLI